MKGHGGEFGGQCWDVNVLLAMERGGSVGQEIDRDDGKFTISSNRDLWVYGKPK